MKTTNRILKFTIFFAFITSVNFSYSFDTEDIDLTEESQSSKIINVFVPSEKRTFKCKYSEKTKISAIKDFIERKCSNPFDEHLFIIHKGLILSPSFKIDSFRFSTGEYLVACEDSQKYTWQEKTRSKNIEDIALKQKITNLDEFIKVESHKYDTLSNRMFFKNPSLETKRYQKYVEMESSRPLKRAALSIIPEKTEKTSFLPVPIFWKPNSSPLLLDDSIKIAKDASVEDLNDLFFK